MWPFLCLYVGSHPHGCVSWNISEIFLQAKIFSHTLTGVWVEIGRLFDIPSASAVTPSRVCELKFGQGVNMPQTYSVTPSRVCELKFVLGMIVGFIIGHTLTGVWVEIYNLLRGRPPPTCHTLTGVWVEIFLLFLWYLLEIVTPSRVCELKYRPKRRR